MKKLAIILFSILLFGGCICNSTPCEKKSCLCVCETDYFSGKLTECNEEGSCLIVENLFEEDVEIQLTVNPPITLIISKVQDEYIRVVKK